MNKIGIIQGRLSPPIEGFQECPINWEKEFTLLNGVGAQFVEWIITSKNFLKNPFFNENLNYCSDVISSVCCDNMVSEKFETFEFLQENLEIILNAARKNNVKNITIPLLEKSDISNKSIREKFCENIVKITDKFSKFNFLFEIESDIENILEIINLRPNYYYVYDTGNMTSFGITPYAIITNIGHKIFTVHLKDKDLNSKTVYPGEGLVNFKEIFFLIKKHKLDPFFVVQTARGVENQEFYTIKKHINFFKNEYNQ